jgi:NTP pyrophosphatase (non-canonical NTP hydrolase)
MNLLMIEEATYNILMERKRQFYKWGDQRHDIMTWTAILMEEVGEFAQAAVKAKNEGGDVNNISKELVQCGAVVVQILEQIYDGEVVDWPVEKERE